MNSPQVLIETAYQNLPHLTPSAELLSAISSIMDALDKGTIRVAEKIAGTWQTHDWIKKAILLYFHLTPSQCIPGSPSPYFDKVPLKFAHFAQYDFERAACRAAPGAIVRQGAYIGAQTILMPSFINIGAYVDTGTLIDTWATVGSCAQIGKYVHISGGAGIGGVLEPIQTRPTIIEDHCFIGARSEIVEGVIVEEGAVISMGVFIGQGTKIYNRMTGEITYGQIPKGAVVVPGSLPSDDGQYQLYAAIIVKQVDLKTREKIGLNTLLRV